MPHPTHQRSPLAIRPLPLVSVAALSFSAGLAAAQTIQQVAPLPGNTWVSCLSLSEDGRTVLGESGTTVGNNYHAVRWSASSGTQSLGQAPGHLYSSANQLSGDGLSAVGVSGSTYDIAAKWTAATGMVSLGALAAGQPSFAFGVSRDGAVIVGDGYLAGGVQRAWKWTAATGMQALTATAPGTQHSLALRVNPAGTHIAGYCYNNAPALVWPEGCLWRPDGTLVTMGHLPGTVMTVPSDLSGDGGTAYGYCADANSTIVLPFRWTSATGLIEALPLPAGLQRGVAGACTSDNSIVTGYGIDALGNSTALIWQSGQPVRTIDQFMAARGINTTGWVFSGATVSPTGTALAGNGTYQGVSQGWYLYLGTNCTSAPVISTHPLSSSVNAGTAASFTVVASGGTVGYQWFKNTSTLLVGQTGPTLTLPAVTAADAGSYSCSLTNLCGTTNSLTATLTVVPVVGPCPTPEFILQPTSMIAPEGSNFQISADAIYGDPIEFQWQHDGVDVPGARGRAPTLSFTGFSIADTGIYVCIAHNDCGDTLSDAVTVSVALPGGCSLADVAGAGLSGNQPDGVIDGSDFVAFINAFAIGDVSIDPAADVNLDGIIDGNDFVAFINAFALGC